MGIVHIAKLMCWAYAVGRHAHRTDETPDEVWARRAEAEREEWVTRAEEGCRALEVGYVATG